MFDLSVWSIVVFFILCAVVALATGKPLNEAMQKRERSIVESLTQAEIAREEGRKLEAEFERQRIKSREFAKSLIEEAKADAKRARDIILERANAEAARTRARIEREINLARLKATHELWLTATELSTDMARKILASQLNEADHRRLIREAMDSIGSRAEAST